MPFEDDCRDLTDHPFGVVFYGRDSIGSHRYAMRTRDGWMGADYQPVDLQVVERQATLEEEQAYNSVLVEYGERRVA